MLNRRIFLNQRFLTYSFVCMTGAVSVLAVPVLAQPALERPLQMAQSASAIAGSWRLANMTESPFPTPMLPSTDLTAEFADGRVSGSGGCNRFNGGYQAPGSNQLSIGPLASTFKACEQSLMDQESRFLKALQGAQRYEMDGPDQLTIYYKTEQNSGVLRFTAQAVRGLW